MHVSSTEAKNKFGQMLDECQHHPVIIEKAGRRRGVLMSAAQYDQLVAKAPQVPGTQTPGEKFYSEYKDWVDMQNDLVEKFGVFGEEYRVW
jgi:prevent-host-death family protein